MTPVKCRGRIYPTRVGAAFMNLSGTGLIRGSRNPESKIVIGSIFHFSA